MNAWPARLNQIPRGVTNATNIFQMYVPLAAAETVVRQVLMDKILGLFTALPMNDGCYSPMLELHQQPLPVEATIKERVLDTKSIRSQSLDYLREDGELVLVLGDLESKDDLV
ncbi:MAG: hypothetical protein ACTSRA_18380 [Promethearchaeota archaeon]